MARVSQDEPVDDYQDPYGQDYNQMVNQNVIDLGTGGGGSAGQSPTPQLQPGQQGYDPYSDPSVAAPPGASPPPGKGPWDPTMANWSDLPTATPPPAAPAPAPPPSPGTPTPPPPTVTTAPPPPSPQSVGGPVPPTAASSIPPDLLSILNSLKEGITNFQTPQIHMAPQTTPAYDDLVRSAIMDAIRQGQEPVNAQDPLVAPLLAAVQGQGQRAKEQNASRVAEELSARHLLNSGARDVATERYNQGIDEASGNTLAQVMTNVLTQRQQRLMQAIQMGANYLNADQARQLQAELANVNSALQQYQAKSSVGLGTLASLLQNQQFYDQLGSNIGMFQQNQNNQAGSFF